MKRRSIVILFVFIWTFLATGGRLASIALGEKYVAAAENQSLYTLTVDTPRGTIFDRNLTPITNRETIQKIAVTPTPQVISQIHANFEGEEKEHLLQLLSSRKPFIIESPKTFSATGAETFLCKNSTPFFQPAVHLVGYLDAAKEKGLSGLQKAYNTLLACTKETTVTYACDATGGALAGVTPQRFENTTGYQKGVITTFDLSIQLAAEAAFPSLKKGAVVIQKAGSGEILAALSAPDYSPQDIESAMENPSLPLLNRFFSAYNVGSVFKLCVAAAALENGITQGRTYTCTGSIDCGTVFACHEEAGHGELDMAGAMAVSCNTYFIDLALAVGGQALYDMAVQMGFGISSTLCEGITSDSGILPNSDELLRSPAEIANFAIGQGVLMATPLQISAMTGTLVSGGIYFPPSLIAGTIDETEKAHYEKTTAGTRIMKRETADTLMSMMVLVMTEGTGTLGATHLVTTGGKTATAQTGIVDKNQKPVTQAWFTGFFPAEMPRYVVTILVEEGSSGGSDAAPVFKTICESLVK